MKIVKGLTAFFVADSFAGLTACEVLRGSATNVPPSSFAVVFVSTKKISDVPALIQGEAFD
jgi:hypothetical protein